MYDEQTDMLALKSLKYHYERIREELYALEYVIDHTITGQADWEEAQYVETSGLRKTFEASIRYFQSRDEQDSYFNAIERKVKQARRNGDGKVSLAEELKSEKSDTYTLVTTVSKHEIRYLYKNAESYSSEDFQEIIDAEGFDFPQELTQNHLGEKVTAVEQVSLDEAMEIFNEDNPFEIEEDSFESSYVNKVDKDL